MTVLPSTEMTAIGHSVLKHAVVRERFSLRVHPPVRSCAWPADVTVPGLASVQVDKKLAGDGGPPVHSVDRQNNGQVIHLMGVPPDTN